jgi:hypothetical protein
MMAPKKRGGGTARYAKYGLCTPSKITVGVRSRAMGLQLFYSYTVLATLRLAFLPSYSNPQRPIRGTRNHLSFFH